MGLDLTKALGGREALHPAQAPRRFPNGGERHSSPASSPKGKSHFHGVTLRGLQRRVCAKPRRHKEQDNGAKAGQAAPELVCQLRSQPWDVQGDQSAALARDAALLKGTSSAVLSLPPASMPRLQQWGVLLTALESFSKAEEPGGCSSPLLL